LIILNTFIQLNNRLNNTMSNDYTTSQMHDTIHQFEVLSPEECIALIARVEAKGFEPLPVQYDKQYRNNVRVKLEDPELLHALLGQVLKHVPHVLNVDKDTKTLHTHRLLHGKWQVAGLDPVLRFYRYDKGGVFEQHEDFSDHVDALRHRGMVTLFIYLNDVPHANGGSTDFFVHDGQRFVENLSVQPQAGKAVCFHQRLTHRGAPLLQGHKYCVRTNILYKRLNDVPSLNTNETNAICLYEEAMECESNTEKAEKAEKAESLLIEAQSLWPDVMMYMEDTN
jgi:hypothetical protein